MNLFDFAVGVNPSSWFWFVSNIVIGVAYLHIPYTMYRWVHKLGLISGFTYLIWFFMAFIIWCGLHHLVMVTTLNSHPVPIRVLVTDVITAIVSFAVAAALESSKEKVRLEFEFIQNCYRHRDRLLRLFREET